MSRLLGNLGLTKALSKVPSATGALGVARDTVFGGPISKVLKMPGGVPAALLGTSWLLQMLGPAAKGLVENKTKGPRQAAEFDREMRYQRELQQIEQRRLETSMLRSSARLAAANPQLYNEVMAGRRLPQGAVVLGGSPRGDLMEELAMGMSMGKFQKPIDPDAEMEMLTRSSQAMGPKGLTETATITRRPKSGGSSQTDEDLLASLTSPAAGVPQ